jgi:predicted nucleic acid-binding protein
MTARVSTFRLAPRAPGRAAHGPAFLDSNVPLHLLSADARKADVAERIVGNGGVASVQVLNEIAAVLLGRLRAGWPTVHELLATVRAHCRIDVATHEVHALGLALAERDRLGVHDAMIVATALRAGCTVLYSEDLQHDRVFERRLRVVDPFREPRLAGS